MKFCNKNCYETFPHRKRSPTKKRNPSPKFETKPYKKTSQGRSWKSKDLQKRKKINPMPKYPNSKVEAKNLQKEIPNSKVQAGRMSQTRIELVKAMAFHQDKTLKKLKVPRPKSEIEETLQKKRKPKVQSRNRRESTKKK